MLTRDLFVSARHALFLGGCLMAAGELVNGISIGVAEDWKLIEYIHVKLPHHDVIWAEGATVESFVGDGSRALFENAAEPGRSRPPPRPCAPRLLLGRSPWALGAV